ncbi:UPF0280 family protein [Thermovibrio sp.]
MVRPEKRFYRRFQKPKGFASFEVIVGESDLWIAVPQGEYSPALERAVEETLISLRSQIEAYGKRRREFFTSLTPIEVEPLAPRIVKKMALECGRCGVGPMAGVAGAINLFIGKKLEKLGIDEFIIENGGDTYISREAETVSLILTGEPRLDGKLAVCLPPGRWGLSSSSSKIGHSLSLGRVQIATVLSCNPVYSDCCATYLGNSTSPENALRRVKELEVEGALVLIDGKFVIKGNLKPVLLKSA